MNARKMSQRGQASTSRSTPKSVSGAHFGCKRDHEHNGQAPSCIHCKACDVKGPLYCVSWHSPRVESDRQGSPHSESRDDEDVGTSAHPPFHDPGVGSVGCACRALRPGLFGNNEFETSKQASRSCTAPADSEPTLSIISIALGKPFAPT
jgi:hypothetical protein